MKKLLPIALGILTLISCGKKSGFEIEKVTLITNDAERLANWYEKNLDFDPSLENDLLYHKNLTILLEESDEARHPDSVKKAYNINSVPGFFKIGFLTNQFDALAEHLQSNDVNFVGNVVVDKVSGRRMLIVKDPEGNRLQLFEDSGKHKLKPYLISLIVDHVGEQEKWYQVKFMVTKTHNMDMAEEEVFIRVLEGKDFLIELIQTPDRMIKSELNAEEITGFYQVVVDGAKGAFQNDHEGNLIISP